MRSMLLLAVATITGCAAAEPAEEETGSVQQPIKNGAFLSSTSPYAETTVSLGYCTGTIIGVKHVLSAAHCAPRVGDVVYFYEGANRNGETARIQTVYMPRGVDLSQQPSRDQFAAELANWDAGMFDTNGKYADIVVIELDRNHPSTSWSAQIPATYIGNNAYGTMVGTGNHDGMNNSMDVMKYTTSKIYSSNNTDGHMLTDSADVDPGDSGGPLYTLNGWGRPIVHGALSGTRWEWAQRAKYTSVSFHVNRILYAMGDVRIHNYIYDGPVYATQRFHSVEECAVACMQSASCNSYAFEPESYPAKGLCSYKSSFTWPRRVLGAKSGYKRSTGTGPCNLENGYCRI